MTDADRSAIAEVQNGVGPITVTERDAVEAIVRSDSARLLRVLAPLYIGKTCPLSAHSECRGPNCQWFLPTGDKGRINGGACAFTLACSQIGPIAEGLQAVSQPVNRVIAASDGQVR